MRVDSALPRLRAHGSELSAGRPVHSAVLVFAGVAPFEFFRSGSATGHHDLLREDEVVDFLAVVPRLDDAELDDFFAAGRGRLGDDSLDDDFFAAGRAGWAMTRWRTTSSRLGAGWAMTRWMTTSSRLGEVGSMLLRWGQISSQGSWLLERMRTHARSLDPSSG